MYKRFLNLDWFLFLPMLLLLIFGLVVLASSGNEPVKQQLIFSGFGLLFYFLFAILDWKTLKYFFPYPLLAVCCLLLIIIFFLGYESRGAVRWFNFGIFQFQPSELTKLGFILFLAAFLQEKIGKIDFFSFFISLVLTAIAVILVFLQPDLGTALVFLAIWLGILIASGLKLRHFLYLIIFACLMTVVIWFNLQPYQKARLTTFLNPSFDPLGAGYNVLQSKIAIGSGQFFGRGFGHGPQSQLRFLPESKTDFVFASIAEEWGFLGASIIIFLFVFLLIKLLFIYKNSQDNFAALISIGVFIMIFVQVFVNIAMNLGLIPVTGIPLPLISQGGSSLLVTMMSLGLVQGVLQLN